MPAERAPEPRLAASAEDDGALASEELGAGVLAEAARARGRPVFDRPRGQAHSAAR